MAPSSQSPLLTDFLTTVNHARANNDPQFLCNCLLLTPHSILQNHLMLSLRSELVPLTPAYIENQCYEILGEEWVSFTDMVIGYCAAYLREVDVEGVAMGSGGVPAMDTWCSELSTLMGQISSAFSSAQGILLLPLVKTAATILSTVAIKIDQITNNPRQPAANDASRIVLRAFNIALGDRTTGNNLGKKEAAFHLANILFKLYFKLDQIRLCPTIHTNLLQSSLPPLLPTHFPKSQHCTYTYYLGRHHLNLSLTSPSSLLPAFTALSTSYSLCPSLCPSQRRLILTYLLPSAILIGKPPTQYLYSRPEAAGLYEIFHPITIHLRSGNFIDFRSEMRRSASWLRQKGLYLLLWRCSEELLWRSLCRMTFTLGNELRAPVNPFNKGLAKTPPPQLNLYSLLHLANFLSTRAHDVLQHAPGAVLFSEHDPFIPTRDAHEEGEYTLDDMEGVVLDLLDQGMIKGYIARQQKVVVLKREGNGFVGVEEARRWKASIGAREGEGAEEG
ncbi:hypothetical protein L211DRAFT_870345, partial [Terfezia boudieri ATCC MYA-4762]